MNRILLTLFLLLTNLACRESFLDVAPQGSVLTQDVLANRAGVAKLLVGAYAVLDGLTPNSNWWNTAGTNFIYGDYTSGDAYKGGTYDGGTPDYFIEKFNILPTNDYLYKKWAAVYDGVARANAVLQTVAKAGDMTPAEKATAQAEARFLRGHYHFDAKKMWNNVPFVDETITDFRLANTVDIWPKIEADFDFAYKNLPATQSDVGRANKWAAACYLAKAKMFQRKYAEAKALLDVIIASGVTSKGEKYDLMPCFHDNFDAATENNQESVFQIQFSASDGSLGRNGNLGEITNTPKTDPPGSFFGYNKQPSQNLVNAYQTDANGLPLLNTFNGSNVTSDVGVESSVPFTPHGGNLDPRLDWSVGRRGIPYLDWGLHPGRDWISDQTFGGPYSPIKNVYRQSQYGKLTESYAEGYINVGSVNYSLIRFADVLLWAAECEVEAGSLEKARTYVNRVRNRAKTGCMVLTDAGKPAANYVVDVYSAPWPSQDVARKAVRFERRLELALEGHRFFDLVRWGIAAEYLNAYFSVEKTKIAHLNDAKFTAGHNEYFPIPQIEIDLSAVNGVPQLKQNPGY